MAKVIRKLIRSSTDKKWLGVCGGVAKYFEIDSTIVRVITIFVAMITGGFPVLVGYVLTAAVIPEK